MISKTIQTKIDVCLFVICLTTMPLWAAEWNYPTPDADRDVKDISFYEPPAQTEVLKNITRGRPRNVILLIGDGMGFNHVAVARERAVGFGGRLYMEQMPITGIMRTHSADSLVTDSAAAATALACGVKTYSYGVGITADGTAWKSILNIARNRGYRTGLVATSRITHATPAPFAANVENRGMEAEIASQMLENRVGILFGGGRKHWLPKPTGSRDDERNLIEEARQAGYEIVHNRQDLAQLKSGPALGLFADDAMTTFAPEPMLDEMTRAAIDLLSGKSKEWFAPQPKFFIVIEGSQIDWAGHANDTDNTVRQTLLFDLAVREALDFAARDKRTLVIVTSDHETGGLLLKSKGNELLPDWNSTDHTAADMPIYAYGPGSTRFSGTRDITEIPKIIAELLGFKNFPAPRKTEKPVLEAAGK